MHEADGEMKEGGGLSINLQAKEGNNSRAMIFIELFQLPIQTPKIPLMGPTAWLCDLVSASALSVDGFCVSAANTVQDKQYRTSSYPSLV